MKQEIQLNFINEELGIGLVSWREAYVLAPQVRQLNLEVYDGRIIYRAKGSAKRISYQRLKKGLRPTKRKIRVDIPDWLPAVPAVVQKGTRKRRG